ncbi:hypothetical protein ACJRO7_017780 [Eucalyptus globulus]|uniref:Uncharacterized protein n=1 Tax=Eucalyptus globulus TaxID=34317 RepID=A0ABD3KRI8_EUCGL
MAASDRELKEIAIAEWQVKREKRERERESRETEMRLQRKNPADLENQRERADWGIGEALVIEPRVRDETKRSLALRGGNDAEAHSTEECFFSGRSTHRGSNQEASAL